MDQLEIFLALCLAGFSGLMLGTAAIAYWKVRGLRLLLVMGAFCLFFIVGLYLAVFALLNLAWELKPILGMMLVSLVFLYASLLKD